MKITDTELAWQAGIIDGEGCLTMAKQIRRGRPSPAFRVHVTVANTDTRLLDPFVRCWGGRLYQIHEQRRDRLGKKWADAFVWHCPETSLRTFLTAMLPHLRGKARQAELLLNFIEHKKSFPRYKGSQIGSGRGGSLPLGDAEIAYRESVWKQVRILNKKGVFARKEAA